MSEKPAGRGGGMAILGKALINFFTITGNSATGNGGGMFVFANVVAKTWESFIISGNTANKGTDIYDLTDNH